MLPRKVEAGQNVSAEGGMQVRSTEIKTEFDIKAWHYGWMAKSICLLMGWSITLV